MTTSSARSRLAQGSAHDVPWVSFCLIALCVCVFSLTQYASRQRSAEAERELKTAVAYFLEHPHLDPGPIIARRIDAKAIEQRRETERRNRIRRGAPPIPKRVQQHQQQQLDTLVAEAYAVVSELPTQRWGFRVSDFDPLTVVTHPFLHERSLHLLCALALLLVIGFHLESTWGGLRFAAFVVLSSAASATAYAIGNSGSGLPLIGMSGVVAALLGAYLVCFRAIWRQPIYAGVLLLGALFLILPAARGDDWSIAAGLEATAVAASQQGASCWALCGGFAFGLLGQFVMGLFGTGHAAAPQGSRRAPERLANPALERALAARSAGRMNEAYGILTELLCQTPDDLEALLAMWNVALDYGRPSDAASAMLRAIRDEVKRNDAAAAVAHWLDLSNRGLNADAEPALLIRLALMLQQQEQSFAAIAALQQALQKSEDANAAVIALRVARASRDLDTDTAREAAWRALASVDLDLEERQSLESLLTEIGSGIETSVSGVDSCDRSVDIELATEPAAREASASGPFASRGEPEPWVDPVLVDEDAGSQAQAESKLKTVELADVVQVSERPPAVAEGDRDYARPAPIDLDVTSRAVRAIAATPISLGPEGLRIEAEGGAKKRVPLDKLEAISVAAVGGLSEKPVILIDLVMNWTSAGSDPLKVLRLRGDRFDARGFVRDVQSPLEALRAFVVVLLRESGAKPLPDEQSAKGMPFASFGDLTAYQRDVLGANEDDPPFQTRSGS